MGRLDRAGMKTRDPVWSWGTRRRGRDATPRPKLKVGGARSGFGRGPVRARSEPSARATAGALGRRGRKEGGGGARSGLTLPSLATRGRWGVGRQGLLRPPGSRKPRARSPLVLVGHTGGPPSQTARGSPGCEGRAGGWLARGPGPPPPRAPGRGAERVPRPVWCLLFPLPGRSGPARQ